MSENKKIKIAIDTLGGDHGKSGFGSYILYFISNLPKERDFEIELFGTEEDRYTYTSGTDIPYSAIKLLETPRLCAAGINIMQTVSLKNTVTMQ